MAMERSNLTENGAKRDVGASSRQQKEDGGGHVGREELHEQGGKIFFQTTAKEEQTKIMTNV